MWPQENEYRYSLVWHTTVSKHVVVCILSSIPSAKGKLWGPENTLCLTCWSNDCACVQISKMASRNPIFNAKVWGVLFFSTKNYAMAPFRVDEESKIGKLGMLQSLSFVYFSCFLQVSVSLNGIFLTCPNDLFIQSERNRQQRTKLSIFDKVDQV